MSAEFEEMDTLSSADLAASTLAEALRQLGYENAVIHVHPVQLGTALALARDLGGLIVKSRPDFEDQGQWYVEWNGRRVGSRGA